MDSTFVNLKTGKVLKEMITTGSGPGEVSLVRFCPQPDKEKLWLFDPNLRTVFNVDYNQAMIDDKYMIKPIAKLDNFAAILIHIDTFFVTSFHPGLDNRFQIFDLKGSRINVCMNYNKIDKYKSIPDGVYSTVFQGSYTVHPNEEKFVFSTTSS